MYIYFAGENGEHELSTRAIHTFNVRYSSKLFESEAIRPIVSTDINVLFVK